MIRTTLFTIAPSATARYFVGKWLERRWWLLGLPFAVALAGALYDVRWIFVAMILLFMVWPSALFFVWTGGALTLSSIRASCPHFVEFDKSGLNIVYEPRADFPEIDHEQIMWPEIERVEQSRKYVIFVMSGRHILIPSSVFDNSEWRQIFAFRMSQ